MRTSSPKNGRINIAHSTSIVNLVEMRRLRLHSQTRAGKVSLPALTLFSSDRSRERPDQRILAQTGQSPPRFNWLTLPQLHTTTATAHGHWIVLIPIIDESRDRYLTRKRNTCLPDRSFPVMSMRIQELMLNVIWPQLIESYGDRRMNFTQMDRFR
jgi:hypothetical protein